MTRVAHAGVGGWCKNVVRVVGLKGMRAFLDGLTLMMHGRWDAAIAEFGKVVRWDRWVRLEDAVPEHRDLGPDARLKIAACHLRRNRPGQRGWVAGPAVLQPWGWHRNGAAQLADAAVGGSPRIWGRPRTSDY